MFAAGPARIRTVDSHGPLVDSALMVRRYQPTGSTLRIRHLFSFHSQPPGEYPAHAAGSQRHAFRKALTGEPAGRPKTSGPNVEIGLIRT